MSVRVEKIGDATLYLGDCLEVLPTLGKVDAVVTDPPYGVDFNGKVTKHADRRGECQSYADDEASWTATVPPAIEAALSIASRAAIFPGTRRLQQYPKARDIGGIITPNGAGMSSWGFGCYHPVLYYGSSPFVGARPTAIVMYPAGLRVTGEDDIDHPCPKPLAFMEWAVARASLECETVLDPFMGSGTTGVACAKLGRKFIGIEIEPRYFDIACRRIEEAYRQPRLFAEPPPKPQQVSFFEPAPSGARSIEASAAEPACANQRPSDDYDPAENARRGYEVAIAACRDRLITDPIAGSKRTEEA